MSTSSEGLSGDEVEAYLDRLAIPAESIDAPGLSALSTLQRAHVTTIPFETLAITGDPHGERTGEGVVLSVPHLYEKIVERRRGGYCFELNGLFHALLDALGYEVQRAAARMASALRVPANHHTIIVMLDRRYVVDVGTGPPMVRQPLPLNGTPQTDAIATEWRAVPSERPDAAYRTEFREPDDADWTVRYVFDDAPRSLRYFEATNDYLQSAPESPFTGAPTMALSTATGYRKLSDDMYEEVNGDEEQERAVPADAWHDLLAQKFGLRYAAD